MNTVAPNAVHAVTTGPAVDASWRRLSDVVAVTHYACMRRRAGSWYHGLTRRSDLPPHADRRLAGTSHADLGRAATFNAVARRAIVGS